MARWQLAADMSAKRVEWTHLGHCCFVCIAIAIAIAIADAICIFYVCRIRCIYTIQHENFN